MLDSRRDIALACTLSALAGHVDGIGYIHPGGLFVSFMSGNSTRLGVSLARANWPNAGIALALIVLFVTGAAAGSVIVLGRSVYRQACVLVTEALLLAAAGLSYEHGHSPLAIAAIVPARGLENAVFQIEGGGGLGLYLRDRCAGQGRATHRRSLERRPPLGLVAQPFVMGGAGHGVGMRRVGLFLDQSIGDLVCRRFRARAGCDCCGRPTAALTLKPDVRNERRRHRNGIDRWPL